jgi:hypothetical protein
MRCKTGFHFVDQASGSSVHMMMVRRPMGEVERAASVGGLFFTAPKEG